jgi:hypothetical protein
VDKSELLKQLRIDRDAPPEESPSRTRLWIGLAIADFLPALRAARLPVTTALRAA